MRNKIRRPDTCPICDYFPCRCPGGSTDEEKTPRSENSDPEKNAIRNEGSFIHHVNNIASVPTQQNHNELMLSANPSSLKPVASTHNDADKIQHNRPAWCTFFADKEKQQVHAPSNNLQQDDSTNNTLGMGMNMCGVD